MKYYKIIQDNNFVGVVSSNNFIYYHPYDHVFMSSNEVYGQYIEYHGKLYRDAWMKPTPNGINKDFEPSVIIEIDEDTYMQFREIIDNNEPINIDDNDEEPEIINIVDPIEEISIEFAKENKIQEMSRTCRQVIEAGFDLVLRGETRHFSLDTQDQLNLISLSAMAQTQELIPYHADGEACIFYTAEEIQQIVAAATSFKIYHTTYHNALKSYINSLETIEEIGAITYGVAIPDEYKTDVLRALEA